MPLIEECVKRNLSTILSSFKDQSDERRLVNRVEEGRVQDRREEKRKLRNQGGGGGGGRGRMRSRPGTTALTKHLSSALDDWGMDEEAGEGTAELFKRIDDNMTMLDDYKKKQ